MQSTSRARPPGKGGGFWRRLTAGSGSLRYRHTAPNNTCDCTPRPSTVRCVSQTETPRRRPIKFTSTLLPRSRSEMSDEFLEEDVGGEQPASELRLSGSDRALLAKSWHKIGRQATQLGIQVLVNCMEECPEIVDMFKVKPSSAGGGAEESSTMGRPRRLSQPAIITSTHKLGTTGRITNLTKSMHFHSHAEKFMQVIARVTACVVNNEANQLDVVNYLHQLGIAHRQRRKRGFRPFYWSLFSEQMILVLVDRTAAFYAGKSERAHLHHVWSATIEFLMLHLRFGYDNGFAALASSGSGARAPDNIDFPASTRASRLYKRQKSTNTAQFETGLCTRIPSPEPPDDDSNNDDNSSINVIRRQKSVGATTTHHHNCIPAMIVTADELALICGQSNGSLTQL